MLIIKEVQNYNNYFELFQGELDEFFFFSPWFKFLLWILLVVVFLLWL